ncbi:MAG: GSCFA domain-containing protein [Pseudomonadota bacterium]
MVWKLTNCQSTLDGVYTPKLEVDQMNPYVNLPSKSFWKLAVADRSMFDVNELWDPKFNIQSNQKVSTFGSCFAQHIGNALSARGFNWLITEQAPQGCSESLAKKYNYGIFTARTGNIYTTSLLKQWTEWAIGNKEIPDEIWQKDGRFYDPFRPKIEPKGFVSEQEVKISQNKTLKAVKESIEKSDYFVFTLGLTESWFNSEHDYEYPMCPGTIAGEFDESKHKFVNQQFQFILKSLSDTIALMRGLNPKLKFILTVSPVPLTATNSGKHVAVATMASKSVLRAVADQLSMNRSYIDYFPSYEIINSPIFKGVFFEPNQRSVNPCGVNFVMDNFFNCLDKKFFSNIESEQKNKPFNHQKGVDASFYVGNDEHCEEALLEAFGDK